MISSSPPGSASPHVCGGVIPLEIEPIVESAIAGAGAGGVGAGAGGARAGTSLRMEKGSNAMSALGPLGSDFHASTRIGCVKRCMRICKAIACN